MLLRSRVHEQVIFDWFLMILGGKNPIIIEDLRYTEQGCLKVVEDPDNKMASSPERRDAIMTALLNRRDGLPAARVQLNAELQATLSKTVVDTADLARLPAHVLGSLASLLRGALAGSERSPAALQSVSAGSNGAGSLSALDVATEPETEAR